MRRHEVRALSGLVFGLFGLAVLTSPAVAETTRCIPILSVPYTIRTPGIYCLARDLSTAVASGHMIDITTSDVVLDLNAHTLSGLAAGPGTEASGIYAIGRNITVKNGTVRGFKYGVLIANHTITEAQGYVVEDVRADRNTLVGLFVLGRGALIQNNHVLATGGTTTLGADAGAVAISVLGSSNRILHNDVVTVSKQGTGRAIGIHVLSEPNNLVVGNRITESDIGVQFWGGDGKYRDNLTSQVGVPYSGGVDAGNNN